MSENNLFRVVDSSCTPECPKRVHHINVCGVLTEVVFELGVEKLLPFEQALKFSKISGFKVEEIDGDSIILPVAVKDSIRDQLAADEVVAKLGELTTQSLKIRAGQKAGGEIYLAAEEEDRDDIIAFILGVAPVAVVEAVTEKIEDDEHFEEIDVSAPVAGTFDEKKYGGTFTEVINGLLYKLSATSYSSEPESTIVKLLNAEGEVVAHGTLEELIALEGKPPAKLGSEDLIEDEELSA